MIDVASRSIGGKCSGALEFGGGASLEHLILSQALGVAPAIGGAGGKGFWRHDDSHTRSGGAQARRGQGGRVSRARNREPGHIIHIGGRVAPLPEGERYLGFIFAKGERPEEVEAALRLAHAKLRFDIGE